MSRPKVKMRPGCLYVVQTMPQEHRASHRAAGNWGRYPHNGAVRVIMEAEEAASLIACDIDGQTWAIRHARVADLDLPRELPE